MNSDRRKRGGILQIGAVVLATLAAAGWLLSFATGRIDIGVAGEWVWGRQQLLTVPDIGIPIAITAVLIGLYLFGVWLLARWVSGSSAKTTFGLLTVTLMGFFCLWAIQTCAPSPHRQLKPNWVLYHWGASGYFVEAQKTDSLSGYLDGYEAEMNMGEVLHKGTHPPGLVIANYGLLKLCRENSWIARGVLATVPPTVGLEFSRVVGPAFLPDSDRAALWLAVLLTQSLAAMTTLPLYGLFRRSLDPRLSLLFAALWPLVPGVSVFLPKSDAIYPVVGCTFLLLSLGAWDRGSLWRGIAAGLVFWLGLMLSLAILPFAAIAGLHALMRISADRPTLRGGVLAVIGVLAGLTTPTLLFFRVTGVGLWRTWALNYQNHAGFYDQFERTYSKWLGANLLELVLTVGAPLTVLALMALVRSCRGRDLKSFATPAAVVGAWVLLWLSGKNMGEAARLWVPLTAAFVWAAGTAVAPTRSSHPAVIWWWLAVCQAVVCLITVATVNGFSPPL